MRRNHQKQVPAPGQQEWHHVFGAYNWADDTIIYTTAARKNSDEFIAFLDHLSQTFADVDIPVVLILDNASYHRSYAAQAAFSVLASEKIMPIFLPAYCSMLNLIERYWRHLKDFACANKLYPEMAEMIRAVEQCLHLQNDLDNENRFSFSKNISEPT
jgi:transposase